MQSTIEGVLLRYREDVLRTMRQAIVTACMSASNTSMQLLEPFYNQMRYHLGWLDRYFQAVEEGNVGKLLRPALLLLVYEVCGAGGLLPQAEREEREEPGETPHHIRCALPAAAAVELVHNFTLMHDDVEDGDTERRHRATVWKLWGVPHAINTGDGLYTLARLVLSDATREQVKPGLVAHLGRVFDEAILRLTEGQFLDIHFEELS